MEGTVWCDISVARRALPQRMSSAQDRGGGGSKNVALMSSLFYPEDQRTDIEDDGYLDSEDGYHDDDDSRAALRDRPFVSRIAASSELLSVGTISFSISHSYNDDGHGAKMSGREVARNIHQHLRRIFPWNAALPISCMQVSVDEEKQKTDASLFQLVVDEKDETSSREKNVCQGRASDLATDEREPPLLWCGSKSANGFSQVLILNRPRPRAQSKCFRVFLVVDVCEDATLHGLDVLPFGAHSLSFFSPFGDNDWVNGRYCHEAVSDWLTFSYYYGFSRKMDKILEEVAATCLRTAGNHRRSSSMDDEEMRLDELAFFSDSICDQQIRDPGGTQMFDYEQEPILNETTAFAENEMRLADFVLRGCGRMWGKQEVRYEPPKGKPDPWLLDQLAPLPHLGLAYSVYSWRYATRLLVAPYAVTDNMSLMFQVAKHHPRLVCIASDRVLNSKHFAYHAASCGPVLHFFPQFARTDSFFVRLCLQHTCFDNQYQFPSVRYKHVLPVHLQVRCEKAQTQPITRRDLKQCLGIDTLRVLKQMPPHAASSLQGYICPQLPESVQRELESTLYLSFSYHEQGPQDSQSPSVVPSASATSPPRDALGPSSCSYPLDHAEIELDLAAIEDPASYFTVSILRDNVVEGVGHDRHRTLLAATTPLHSMKIPTRFKDPSASSVSIFDVEWRSAETFDDLRRCAYQAIFDGVADGWPDDAFPPPMSLIQFYRRQPTSPGDGSIDSSEVLESDAARGLPGEVEESSSMWVECNGSDLIQERNRFRRAKEAPQLEGSRTMGTPHARFPADGPDEILLLVNLDAFSWRTVESQRESLVHMAACCKISDRIARKVLSGEEGCERRVRDHMLAACAQRQREQRTSALRHAALLFYQYSVEEARSRSIHKGEQYPVPGSPEQDEGVEGAAQGQKRPSELRDQKDGRPELLQWVAFLFLVFECGSSRAEEQTTGDRSGVVASLEAGANPNKSTRNGTGAKGCFSRSSAHVDLLRFCPAGFRERREELITDAIMLGRSDITACAPWKIRKREKFAFLASAYGPVLGFLPTFRDFSAIVPFCMSYDLRQVKWVPLRSEDEITRSASAIGEYNARGLRLMGGITPKCFVLEIVTGRCPQLLKCCFSGFRELKAMCTSALLMCPECVPERFYRDREFVLRCLRIYIIDAYEHLDVVDYTFAREAESKILRLYAGDAEVLEKTQEAAKRRDEVQAAGGPKCTFPPEKIPLGVVPFHCYEVPEQEGSSCTLEDDGNDSETSSSLFDQASSQAGSFYSAFSVDT